MDIITWNIYEMGNDATLRAMRNLVHSYYPAILMLVEPKNNGQRADEQYRKIGFFWPV